MEQNANPTRKVFTSTLIEKIAAVLIYPITFFYVRGLLFQSDPVWEIDFGIFAVSFFALAAAMYWKRKWNWEMIVFGVLTLLVLISSLWDIGTVWDQDEKIVLLHLFAVYFVLCRSNRLAEGQTSHMFLWDGITGFFVMPFKNFHRGIQTIISIFRREKTDGEEKKKSRVWLVILIVIPAAAVGILLLCIAISCLRGADDNYSALLDRFGGNFRFKLDGELIAQLILAIPGAMYLYGLLGGCYRETEAQVQHRGDNIKRAVNALAKVPPLVWIIFIGLFSAFYIVFFLLQGSYLFGAFRMILPEQYTFAEYARKGFGETCGIMAVNMVLTWISVRTSEKGKMHRGIQIACGILTCESMLFAAIALMKLVMYIHAYGFTPLRLQSFWLVLVLLFACICILVSLFAQKKTARIWALGSAASFAVLCMI